MLNNIMHYFKFQERNTTFKKELAAGALNFIALAWVLFLVPALLRQAGMGYGAPFTAVCVASAVMCLLMGLIGKSPVPLAPLLSTALLFVFSGVIDFELTWKQALAAVLVESVLFILIASFKLRDLITNAIPASLKYSVYAGIGIFMVLLGLRWAGIVIPGEKTLVTLGSLKNPAVVTSILGIIAVLVLFLRNVKGSLILGSLITLVVALIAGVIAFKGFAGLPPPLAPVFFSFDWPKNAKIADFVFMVIILLYVHASDSLAGAINTKQPGTRLPSILDAIGSLVGAIMGAPNTGSAIEGNAGGISTEGRTGVANMTTGLLFIAALFLFPIVKLLGAGVETKAGMLYPMAAPVLVLLGMLMLQKLQKINLADLSESFPAILTLLVVPFTFSIAHGLAFGVIAYPIVKAIQGKFKDVPAAVYVLAVLFLVYYIFFY